MLVRNLDYLSIPKEFKPRIMPDGRSIEVTGLNGKKEVW